MTQTQQQKAAKKFIETWTGKGYEKGESQKFWLDLLCNVFGVTDFANFITFEDQVKLDHTSFIDGYVPSTKVLIEQKSIDKDLRAPIVQSDGSRLNPFQQAKRYITEMPVSKHPRWVVTCNFKSFLIYDMENPNGEPEEVLLENLEKEYDRLSFITDTNSVHLKKELQVSKDAGDIVGLIYDKLLEQYKLVKNIDMEKCLKSLNMLCVRLVFCLYAEDAGIFGHKSMFGDYLKHYEAKDLRSALLNLFKVLDQKPEERDPFLEEELAAFPYVNGGLFTEEDQFIPHFTDELKDLLVNKASDDFNWSEISPTIFGAVFESTLNPETRRSGGMHYTSIENIHKVIDPLFLDELNQEFENIKENIKQQTTKNEKLTVLKHKLSELKFLDPACGSGNFLTETYLSLRRLENKIIRETMSGNYYFSELYGKSIIEVSIHQFYGIEINDFAVTVAKTALWIAESQMYKETASIPGSGLNDFLPLKTYANISENNALTIDWGTVVPKNELNYIMGNPPFVGASMMTEKQKSEAVSIFGKIKLSNSIDYVGAWYYKAAEYIQNTNIKCALVSTNSITQGEQVAPLWKNLFARYNIKIDFAYRTFRWDSEANLKAHVHCVIIGFSNTNTKTEKIIFTTESTYTQAKNINPYLLDVENIFIESKSKPICNVSQMYLGNKPADGGNLILSEEDKNEILKKEPNLSKYIYKYLGSEEYINNKIRYCLWLVDVKPDDIKKSKELQKRLSAVKEMRLASTAEPTRQKAETPHLFFFISQPKTNYLLVPSTSSERRRYIPIGFMTPDVIASNAATIVPNASLYEFGIMTSNVHMAWMRTVCGRLKSDYRYSNSVVYNTFPWPINIDETMKHTIEDTAQMILDVRSEYSDSSLATLYDELAMPTKLREAHRANDRAVMQAYGFSTKITESECVAELFKMYEKLTK